MVKQTFWDGFEKRAKLSAEQRAAYEKEMHAFNKEQAGDTGKFIRKMAPLGAGAGGVIGSLIGVSEPLAHSGKSRLLNVGARGLGGAGAGALLGAGLGLAGSAYWRHRSPKYLKKVTDTGLEHGIKGVRKYRKGDTEALNKAYLEYERKKEGFEKKAVGTGLLTIDATKGMPEEEREAIKSKVPWLYRNFPGVIPMSLIGAAGGHSIADLAHGGKNARLAGGAIGSLGLGLATAGLANKPSRLHRGVRAKYEKVKNEEKRD